MNHIKCGHCGQYHDTVDLVRECSRKGTQSVFETLETTETVKPVAEQVGVGFYKHNGDVYRVKKSSTSERLFAQKQVAPEGRKPRWVYAAGMRQELSEENRLTVEDAAAYGKRTGFCMICGRLLTDPKSVEAGIGPVCAGRL